MSAEGPARLEEPVDNDIAFFCIADSRAYVPMVITTLASVRRFHPTADFLVLGPFGEDVAALDLLSQHEIRFEHLDLSSVFLGTEPLDTMPKAWPSECFWWTYAYELLIEVGYEFSCYLDGDVLGVSPLDLTEVFGGEVAVSGVAKRNGRVNSGVLFFDHERMRSLQFFEKALHIYQNEKVCDHAQCTGYCRAKGDQGLLWEVERHGELTIKRVANSYNHMVAWDAEGYLENNPDAPFSIKETRLLHLMRKPWRGHVSHDDSYPLLREAHAAWWEFARIIWPSPDDRRLWFGSAEPRIVDQR